MQAEPPRPEKAGFKRGRAKRQALRPPFYEEALKIGDAVRDGRLRHMMTQAALAERLGMTPTTIAQWERGFARPSLETRMDLAELLAIPFDQLLPEAPVEVVLTDPVVREIAHRCQPLSAKRRALVLELVVALADPADPLPERADPERADPAFDGQLESQPAQNGQQPPE